MVSIKNDNAELGIKYRIDVKCPKKQQSMDELNEWDDEQVEKYPLISIVMDDFDISGDNKDAIEGCCIEILSYYSCVGRYKRSAYVNYLRRAMFGTYVSYSQLLKCIVLAYDELVHMLREYQGLQRSEDDNEVGLYRHLHSVLQGIHVMDGDRVIIPCTYKG